MSERYEAGTISERRQNYAPTADGSIPVICVGLGAIGQGVAETCAASEDLRLVGAVDPRRVSEQVAGVEVQSDLSDIDDNARVAVLSTTSDLELLLKQVSPILERGLDVVSTCEELAYAWTADAAVARELDVAARNAGRTVVGAGVNPGLTMDYLPVVLASACVRMDTMAVRRAVDLCHRRQQLADKLGIGLTEDDWRREETSRGLGHRGLVASARVCAAGLGWEVESVKFSREPISEGETVSEVRETAELSARNGRRLTLRLSFGFGGEDVDEVSIDSGPALRIEGLNGDEATVARAVSFARSVGAAPSGLRLPIEIAPWSANGTLPTASPTDPRRVSSRRKP